MSIETLTFTSCGPTKGRGYKLEAIGSSDWLYCFESKVAADIQDHLNVPVNVDVDRSPNPKTGKVFPTVKSFHGAANVAAPQVAAAAPAQTTTHTPRSGGGGSSSFKKDPVGIVLGARQTSLNVAVAYATHFSPESAPWSPEAVIQFAREFYTYLMDGLPVELPAAEVSDALAMAALVNPAAATDDEIPF